MDALAFASLTRTLGDVAHEHRLDVPSFVGRVNGPERVITRTAEGCIVKVRRDRDPARVSDDLIAGIVKTNGISDKHPAVADMQAAAAIGRLNGDPDA